MNALEQVLLDRSQIAPFFSTTEAGTLEATRKQLPEDLIVECTSDMQYINQYFFIREYAYRNDLEVKTFCGEEDEMDKRSYQLIARKGHFCIGGSRLVISTPDKPAKLPLERGDFNLHDHLPFLEGGSYGEVGRTAILPQFRDSAAVKGMFNLSIEMAKEKGCKYLFGASPPSVARLFQRQVRQLGYRDELRPDIPIPMGDENKHLNLTLKIIYLEN